MKIIHKQAQQIKKNIYEIDDYIIKISDTNKTATVYDYETLTQQKKRIFETEEGEKYIKYKSFNATEYIFLEPIFLEQKFKFTNEIKK